MTGRIEGDNRPVTFTGLASLPFTSQGLVQHVATDIELLSSQKLWLVTSSLGGVFPDGLKIGSITGLEVDSQGLFQSGNVELDERLNRLSEVAVLIPKSTES